MKMRRAKKHEARRGGEEQRRQHAGRGRSQRAADQERREEIPSAPIAIATRST